MDTIEYMTSEQLVGLDGFAGLSAESLERLFRSGRVLHLTPRQKLLDARARGAADYYFLLRGVIAIALEPWGLESTDDRKASKRPPKDQRYLGFFEPGACFSDVSGPLHPMPGASVLTCIAVNAVSLLHVQKTLLESLLATEDTWREQLTNLVARQRERFLNLQDPARRLVQDFFLRENYVTSSVVRVGRLDRCLDCNKCHDACEARHGESRMARMGPSLGRLTFPIACRNCHDQPCISACSFGGISVDALSGDMHISDRCVGCGACAAQCPNEAISMVWRPYTSADFPDPMPQCEAGGMTNIDRLLVAGDVSGAALIRLAMNDAVRAVDRIEAPVERTDVERLDVVIVGAGPAGLAAAMRAEERGLSYRVLERDWLASTIRSYPKNKHVMAEPSNVELISSLWFEDCSREELLEHWHETVRDRRLRICEQTEVRRIEKAEGGFSVYTDQGCLIASNVLVCIGKRGAPRRLGVAGETPQRVRYLLDDPEQYAGKRVLVVGGGDSALEAALALADVPGTHITLSYRRDAFARAKVPNRKRLEAYQNAGRIRIELKSSVIALDQQTVRLRSDRGELKIPNDIVFALLGADPPTEFLQGAGIRVLQPGSAEMATFAAGRGKRQRAVKCDHCSGYPDRACLTACPTGALIEVQAEKLFLEKDADPCTRVRRFSDAPFLDGVPGKPSRWKLGVTIGTLAILAAIGIECFLIRTQPEASLLGRYVHATRAQIDVSYTSGRGIGHWFGYFGAGMMLTSCAYSLRTRLGWFRHWGSQTGWFSTHIWLGFTGATLVTYHSALKLDRWASIACMLMWLVVITGAIGRYFFGRVRSAAGLADFERDALRFAQGSGRRTRVSYYRSLATILRYWNVVHIILAIAMAILAGTHIFYGFRYKAV